MKGKCSSCGRTAELYNGECLECINKDQDIVISDSELYGLMRFDELPLSDKSIRINRYAGVSSEFMLKRNNILALEQHTKDFICKGCTKCQNLREKIAFNKGKFMKGKLTCEEIKKMKGVEA